MRRAACVLILGLGAALAGGMAAADEGAAGASLPGDATPADATSADATPTYDSPGDAACTTCDARQTAKTRMLKAREAAQAEDATPLANPGASD